MPPVRLFSASQIWIFSDFLCFIPHRAECLCFQAKMSDNFAELGWTFFTMFSHFIDQTIYRLIWKIIGRLTDAKNNLYLQPQQTREYFAHSPPFSSSFVRPLQSMLWIKLPFKKRAMFCESRCELAIQTDHSHWGKTENTNVVCEHVCMHEGWFGGRGGILEPS